MKWTIRPLSDVTGFGAGGRQESQFTIGWTGVVTLLERELDMLQARNVVLELDVREDQIRIDGQLRASTRAASGRVRLAFDCKHGALVYATDRFTRGWSGRGGKRKMEHDWQHNLYAIGKALEALRLVDRYGVNTGQQYVGFKALPAGRAMPASHMTATEATAILFEVSNEPSDSPIAKAWRRARAVAHPDRHDGDRTMWDRVETAAGILGLTS